MDMSRNRAWGPHQPTFAELFTPKLITVLREGYGIADLRADILSGLTVAIVALPLSVTRQPPRLEHREDRRDDQEHRREAGVGHKLHADRVRVESILRVMRRGSHGSELMK